jgi:hypothetical protein
LPDLLSWRASPHNNAIFAADDDAKGRALLIKHLDASKINLQQGLTDSEQQG